MLYSASEKAKPYYNPIFLTSKPVVIPEFGDIIREFDVDTGVISHLMFVDSFTFPVRQSGNEPNHFLLKNPQTHSGDTEISCVGFPLLGGHVTAMSFIFNLSKSLVITN